MAKHKPYRHTIDFLSVHDTEEGANRLWERIVRLIEGEGAVCEGGTMGQMLLEDVIPGSPLDKRYGDLLSKKEKSDG